MIPKTWEVEENKLSKVKEEAMKRGNLLGLFVVIVSIYLVILTAKNAGAADEYVIGYIADITGPTRSFYGPESEGFRLFVDNLNSKGGINGRKIKLVLEDGKSNPAISGAIAKKMIERDEVLGIFGLGISASQLPVFDLATKAKVPVVCGYSCAYNAAAVKPGDVIFSTGFVMVPDFHPGGYVYALTVKNHYPKTAKVAVGGYASPGARVWDQWTKKWLEKWGYKVLYEATIPPGTVDLSAWVAPIAQLNPDIFTIAVGGEIFIPYLPSLEKAGWTKDMLIPYGVIESDVVKTRERLIGNGEWILWVTRYTSAYDKNTVPEFQLIENSKKKFGGQFPLSAEHAQGWTMGLILESALKKAGWPCTREKLLASLENIEVDTKGLTGGPIKFTPTDHYGPAWFKLYRWNDTKKALVPKGEWYKVEISDLKN